jgi:hypothetical protein
MPIFILTRYDPDDLRQWPLGHLHKRRQHRDDRGQAGWGRQERAGPRRRNRAARTRRRRPGRARPPCHHGALRPRAPPVRGPRPSRSSCSAPASSKRKRCHTHALPGPSLTSAFPGLLFPGQWRCLRRVPAPIALDEGRAHRFDGPGERNADKRARIAGSASAGLGQRSSAQLIASAIAVWLRPVADGPLRGLEHATRLRRRVRAARPVRPLIYVVHRLAAGGRGRCGTASPAPRAVARYR